MTRLTGARSKKAGMAPGTLVYVGEGRLAEPKISVFEYSESWCEDREIVNIEDAFGGKRKPAVRWINIDGLQRVEMLETIGRLYGIHHLVLEDILQTAQRPKTEDYDDYLFIVLKMLRYNSGTGEVDAEQVSFVVGANVLFTFQEGLEGDVFESIRARLRARKGQIRSHGADYLAYSLIDAIVDHYFVILEALGDRIDDVEEELLNSPTKETLHEIYRLKRELLLVRKAVWPLREVVGQLQRGDSSLVRKATRLYLRDLYDHTVAVVDTLENEREVIAGMIDIYLSSVSNRLNEVMKVLTIIATIFIPLTFIVGVYGMNFDPDTSPLNMPELRWYWGYPAIMLVMTTIGVVMLSYFKRKKWF